MTVSLNWSLVPKKLDLNGLEKKTLLGEATKDALMRRKETKTFLIETNDPNGTGQSGKNPQFREYIRRGGDEGGGLVEQLERAAG